MEKLKRNLKKNTFLFLKEEIYISESKKESNEKVKREIENFLLCYRKDNRKKNSHHNGEDKYIYRQGTNREC